MAHEESIEWAREVVQFERFYERRLRDAAIEFAREHECGALGREILRELLMGTSPPVWLAWRLRADAAYLGRTLKKLKACGYVRSERDEQDRRLRQVSLTDLGVAAAQTLEKLEEASARKLIDELPRRQQERLVDAMTAIREILERHPATNAFERALEARREEPDCPVAFL